MSSPFPSPSIASGKRIDRLKRMCAAGMATTRWYIVLLLAVLAPSYASAQLYAQPIKGPGMVYELESFSVAAPPGTDWFEMGRDRNYLYFGKKISSPTHSFIATVISARVDEKFKSPEEFRDFVRRSLTLHGDRRNTVIEFRAELDHAAGQFCVRHYTKAEDNGALDARGKALLAETYGLSCLHPQIPALSVDVSYTERGQLSEASPELREEGENFIASLRFKPR